jgi:hypothetical protein
MITADLISYIRRQQDINVSRDTIESNLKSVGWHPEDIEEGFIKTEEIREREQKFNRNTNEENNNLQDDSNYQTFSIADKYREPIDLDAEPLAKKEIPTGVKKKEIKETIETKEANLLGKEIIGTPGTPENTEPLEVTQEKNEENIDSETKEQPEEILLPEQKELIDIVNPYNVIIEKSQINTNNIFELETTDSNQPKTDNDNLKNIDQILESNVSHPEIVDTPITTFDTNLQNQNKDIDRESKIDTDVGINISQDVTEKSSEKEPLVEPVLSANALEEPNEEDNVWLPRPIPVKEIEAPEENQDDIVIQNTEIPENTLSQEKLEEPKGEVDNIKLEPEKSFNFNLENLPKIVPISTYKNDILTTLDQIKNEKPGLLARIKINKKMIKWMIIAVIVILIGGGLVWALTSGKIDFKNINIPFINKDPRNLILNNSKILASLDSYKTEVTLEIKVPSLASISAGLLTGEAVSSLDKDNLILNSSANITQKDDILISDNSVTIQGSTLEEFISAKIKNDGQYLYLNFPDLSNVLKEESPLFGSVKISEQEFYLVPPLFGDKTENILNKVNLYKILSSGIPAYIDQETLLAYEDIIKSVQITKRGEEFIKGVNTLHYSINPDKELFKSLMKKVVEKFVGGINELDKENIDLIISSTNVTSFGVWVGKGDNAIYQYNIVLEIPMTKILGFEDKSVGNNIMNISLKATYFDFNVENQSNIPSDYIEISEFVKSAKIESIKNKVKEFSTLALNLKKVEKKYGTKLNSKGSCMSPVSGSLFSPTGHPKTAILPVSEISSFLNYVLGLTGGRGTCYSTTTDWSFAIPLTDNYENIATSEEFNRYYCVDSKGGDIEIASLPKGVVCEQ